MADETLAGDPELRARIRAHHDKTGRRFAVLDDDPTGSQSVHGVTVVTGTARDEIAAGLAEGGATCFILTNSRSLDDASARALNDRVARELFAIEDEIGVPVEIVSRSDSTLRGHVYAEISTLERSRRAHTGRGYHAVVFAPAFLEAGRFTEGDVHFARIGGDAVPVGETEFARDATFGYRASNLREFLAEVSGGKVKRAAISSLPLDEIRGGGPERVAEVIGNVAAGSHVVVNATTYADLETVALGALLASSSERRLCFRSGPSLVRALGGVEPRPPLGVADIYPDGPPARHGLIVVGSHVGLTNAQLETARAHRELVTVELDAAALEHADGRAAMLRRATDALRQGLEHADALVVTSRTLRRGKTPEESLRISRQVSDALVEVVRGAREAEPAFYLSKGGITSHDIAIRALDIRRATVVGQLLPGMVSLLSPIDAAREAVGVPYVVFAGNVGDDTTLERVIATLDGTP